MPDDSNGIYSVPAGTIVTTGDTILPSQHNPWANDSASAISNRFSKDGRAPATGNWNINSFRLTNVGAPVAGGDAVNKTYADALDADKLDILQPSVDVASATTTDIGAAASQNVRITGSVTITSLGIAPAGTFRRLTFAAAPLLTYNATSLILPGGVNITAAAGDVAEFVSEGSGNWRCVNYTPITGSPIVTPWVAYTPTFSGLGTVTNVNVRSKRVGGNLEVRFKFTAGTVTTSEARMTLGFNGTNNNVTSDTTIVNSTQFAGSCIVDYTFAGSVNCLIESGLGYITFSRQGASENGLQKSNGNVLTVNNGNLSGFISIPIQGWN